MAGVAAAARFLAVESAAPGSDDEPDERGADDRERDDLLDSHVARQPSSAVPACIVIAAAPYASTVMYANVNHAHFQEFASRRIVAMVAPH